MRHAQAPQEEPEQFERPSESEHLLQVTDVNPAMNPDGPSDHIYSVKLEVVGGEDEGKTLLHRVNIDDSEKAFYYCRMFLKALQEPYKGEFDIDPDNWVGKQFYATVKHNGKYANIEEYNFDNKVENQYKKPVAEAQTESEW